ncbi:hypothetical protein F7P69_02055 [Cellulosimicrobium funkei]|nr:hypothetical protein [Cellulosimicrobium funkei]
MNTARTSDQSILDGARIVVRRLIVDNRRMTELTGWSPTQEFSLGIRDLVEWFRTCGTSPQELLDHVSATNWSGESVPT